MKIFITIAVGVVAGVGYWLLSPLWRTDVVHEDLPEGISSFSAPTLPSAGTTDVPSDETPDKVPELIELYTGSFTGFDRLHQGSGTTKIIRTHGKTYVRFETDFTVSNGPDLFVGFGKDGVYGVGSEVGALKGNVGAQNYELPEGFDVSKYNEVYVWCRAFSVPFAKAHLTRVSE